MSSSVTVYDASNVSSSPGANVAIVHSSPVNSSVTVISFTVKFPSFVTVISYAISSPNPYFPSSRSAVLVVTFVTVKCGAGSSVGSSVVPGVVGTFPEVAVASFTTESANMSSSVTVYEASNSSLSPGANTFTSHSSPVNSSSTVIPSTVTFPSFVTVIKYVISSPNAYFPSSLAAVLVVTFVTVKCGFASSGTITAGSSPSGISFPVTATIFSNSS